MKLAKIGLVLIISLVLMVSLISPALQASAESDDVDVSATVPLVISGVSASNFTTSSATISWNTNAEATSQVFYDTVYHDDIALYAYHTEDIALVTEHSIPLTGLSSGRTYHYRVRSAIPDTEFEDISQQDSTFKTSSPAPPPDEGPPTYYTRTNLFGVGKSYRISRTGEILKTIVATSEDENLTMTIPEGTIALGEDGKRLKSLQVAVNESPPEPPEDAHIIGLAYDFGPDGATFDPPLTLEYTYDTEALPDVADLFLAYYDEETGEWVELDCVVDTVNNIITASVPHFTTFAIIGIVVPPPPPPPAPARFTIRSLGVSPSEVSPGEEVTISVLVANTGGKSGSYQVTLIINDLVEATKEVTVRAGLSKEVTFSVTREEAGSYTITVNGLSGSFTVVAPLIILEPATFSVSSLSVLPVEVESGETVTITVSVDNTGGTEGSYTVVLKIDGVKEAEETVTVAAGESEEVSFSVTREEADSYAVAVDGLRGSFTVVAPVVTPPSEPGVNWALYGWIIAAAVIVAGLLIYFLWFRRRAYY